MILSDRTIREELAAGRIAIEPLDESSIQPSSVDLRLDRLFRVFLNHTMPVIDVKKNLEDLTRLVEIDDDDAFILHPGEFVLGSTYERIALPDDLVARIEGKSSLGRLGLLIHSSLPASEPLLVLDADGLTLRTIGELVNEPRPCHVVGFDPDTLEVGYHAVTGFYEGPVDKVYEVRLASGRAVRVTAGHNLFTPDTDGSVRRVRTAELRAGLMIAVPGAIPEPPGAVAVTDTLIDVDREEARLLGKCVAQGHRPPRAVYGWPDPILRAFVDGLDDGPGDIGPDLLLLRARLAPRSDGEAGVAWDRVVDVVETGEREAVFDLEVRPGGRKVENFVAGSGGVFVSNTAGFVDAGFDGHITLELSNVANLPITLYPGMKIGQVSFLRMSTPADVPYGKGQLGSKYQGQRGPTPSRYWENFR